MTTIKATCGHCGEVTLTPGAIRLWIDHVHTADSFYEFTCPGCAADIVKPADERIVRLLLSGGVLPQVPPQQLTPKTRCTAAPAFTHDDELDFHELLATSDWFDKLLTLTRRSER